MSRFSKDQREEIYSVALNVWGAHAQELMAVEEMSELTQALSKHFRGKTDLVNIVEEIADEYTGKVVVAKVDVDGQGELAQRYRIMNIPTLLVFKRGEVVDKAIGARPKAALEQMLNKAL